MSNEIIIALITQIAAILSIFFTQFFTHKYSKKSHKNTIIEDQYNYIFVPIIEVLSFSKKKSNSIKLKLLLRIT